MTQLVINLSKSGFSSISSTALATYERANIAIPSKNILILGSILAILQILDGLLTGLGMYYFGTSAEGNPLLRMLMENYGYVNALVLTKLFALGVIGALCMLASKVSWISMAFKGVIAIYLLFAVIPWTVILLTRVA